MASLHAGQNFSSFLEFKQCLSCYENENFVKFSKQFSRKIESATRSGKTKNVELNPDIIYYEIKYRCVRGGSFRVQGTGKRKTSSLKIDCPAHISLKATPDGTKLEIRSLNVSHNHEISEELFRHLPHQRKLAPEVKVYVKELLAQDPNKKLLQQKLQRETGKVITLKDLSNLAAEVKRSDNPDDPIAFLQLEYGVSEESSLVVNRNNSAHKMSSDSILIELKNAIKDYPDFPKKGILFKDFLPIFQKPKLVDDMLSVFQEYLKLNASDVDCIAGIESHGFLIGPALAMKLQVPFIPIRKPGKLPGPVIKGTYLLEYGLDALEIQCEAIKDKRKIVIVDNLLATGGTMAASVNLVKSLGAEVAACLVVIELNDLKGREKISEPVHSLIQY